MSNQSIWLIRTKQNKILGPVSKNKIQELLSKGALTPDDEICSGNGYWFWVKEQELVDKFVYGEETQPFNPVSEASTIIAVTGYSTDAPEYETPPMAPAPASPVVITSKEDDEETLVPDEGDLEYPNPEDYKDLKVEAIKVDVDLKPEAKKLSIVEPENTEDEEIIIPEADDLEYPDFGEVEISESDSDSDSEIDSVLEDEKNEPLKNVDDLEDEELEEEAPQILGENTPETTEEKISKKAKAKPVLQQMPKPVKKKKKKKKKSENTEEVQQLKKKNDKVLLYLSALAVFILFYGIYFYYTSILGKSIVRSGLNIVIPTAHAQEVRLTQKKKSPRVGEIFMSNIH